MPIAPAQEKDQAKEDSPKAEASPLKQAVIDNPENVNALRTYLIDRLNALRTLTETDPDAAQKQVEEIRAFLKTLKPEKKPAQQLLAAGQGALAGVEQQITLAKLTLKDITAALDKNPDDAKAVQNYALQTGLG